MRADVEVRAPAAAHHLIWHVRAPSLGAAASLQLIAVRRGLAGQRGKDSASLPGASAGFVWSPGAQCRHQKSNTGRHSWLGPAGYVVAEPVISTGVSPGLSVSCGAVSQAVETSRLLMLGAFLWDW